MGTAQEYAAGSIIPGTKYRVIRVLGKGGMGTVYEVEDTAIEKRYVLKTLRPNLSGRDDLRTRMVREAKTLAKLEHKNIVQVITADVTADALRLHFIVMEKLNGHTLRTVLDNKGSIDVDPACRLLVDVLNALYAAHEHRIVHRDVKPENIFLHRDPDGVTVPKLLDFGIITQEDGPGANDTSATGNRFVGTLRYAAPEQLLGARVSVQTDLYAAGLVLFEAITGRGPFDEFGDPMAIAQAHMLREPPKVSTLKPVPTALDALIASALAKKPADRPHDAFTFAAELNRIARELRGELPKGISQASTIEDFLPAELEHTSSRATHEGTGHRIESGPPGASTANPYARTESASSTEIDPTPRGAVTAGAPNRSADVANVAPGLVDRSAPTHTAVPKSAWHATLPLDSPADAVSTPAANAPLARPVAGDSPNVAASANGALQPPPSHGISEGASSGAYAFAASHGGHIDTTHPPSIPGVGLSRGLIFLFAGAAVLAGIGIGVGAFAIRHARSTARSHESLAQPAARAAATRAGASHENDPVKAATPHAPGKFEPRNEDASTTATATPLRAEPATADATKAPAEARERKSLEAEKPARTSTSTRSHRSHAKPSGKSGSSQGATSPPKKLPGSGL